MAATDIEAVNAAVEALARAMVAGDRAQMAALTAEQLSYGHASGMIETKPQFIENIAGGNNVFKSIDLSATSVAIVGNAAIARHVFDAQAVNAGQPISAHIGVLQVWIRDGGWKLLARQAFKLS